jgi:MFS family permease
MAVQGGFVLGTLASAIANLPDLINPRRLFAAGCVAGAAANASLVLAGSPLALILLRVATGISLAWVYPPGMKVAAGWFERRRGAALGVLIGALTVGSAFPHLLAAASATVAWRTLILSASALAVAAAGIIVARVSDGPYVSTTARFDPRAAARVFAERGTRIATLAYLGHMWELYAVWTWMAMFAAASLAAAGEAGIGAASSAGSAVAFITIASGAIGSAAAGWVADTAGKARVARQAMIISAVCAAASGFVFDAPRFALVALAVVWGVAVVADSAQLSALVAQYSPRDHVGTALTIQTCAGFLLTMASIRLVPLFADAVGWRWAFLMLVPGPAIGALLLRGLDDRERT